MKNNIELYKMIKNTTTGCKVLSDMLTPKFPPLAYASSVLEKFTKKQTQKIRSVIINEIAEGDFSNIYSDDFISLIYKIGYLSISGTATANLRLMVRLMNGMCNKETYSCGSFNRYAKMLEDLSPEEIVMLSETAKAYTENKQLKNISSLAVDKALLELIGSERDPQKLEKWMSVCSGLASLGLFSIHTGFAQENCEFGGVYYMNGYLEDIMENMENWGLENI